MKGKLVIEQGKTKVEAEFVIADSGLNRYLRGDDPEARYLCFNYLRCALVEAIRKLESSA